MNSSYSSLDGVLSHWAHFTVRRLIYLCLCVFCVFFCFILHSCCSIVSAVGWTWWDWSLILRTSLSSCCFCLCLAVCLLLLWVWWPALNYLIWFDWWCPGSFGAGIKRTLKWIHNNSVIASIVCLRTFICLFYLFIHQSTSTLTK